MENLSNFVLQIGKFRGKIDLAIRAEGAEMQGLVAQLVRAERS